MAITIHQQPDLHSAISTPLIVTATSTNSSNDGFKYMVRVEYSPSGANVGTSTYYIDPNAHDVMIFDLAPSTRPYLRAINYAYEIGRIDEDATWRGSVHAEYNAYGTNLFESPSFNVRKQTGICAVDFVLLEAWNVDGIFTVNEASATTAGRIYVYNFTDFTIKNGYKPSLTAAIGHEDGDQSRIMSDRLPTTYDWAPARFLNLSQPNAIYIPARESDWGMWDMRGIDNQGNFTNATKVRLSILPNSGAPQQVVMDLSSAVYYYHLPFWPANLNATTNPDVLKPQDFPNWKAIYFQILNDDLEPTSMSYVMFNVDHPQYGECSCHGYEVVRLAWIGRRGGWEYYNFTLLSETEYETESKVAKRVIGNFGDVSVDAATDFYFNPTDESEFVTYKKINKFVTCNTDILQPGEWEFLKGLILSKQVHWVHDDGTHTPVIIQDSNFKVRNPKSKAREALTVRFKVAQDQSN